jgi:TonB family protein
MRSFFLATFCLSAMTFGAELPTPLDTALAKVRQILIGDSLTPEDALKIANLYEIKFDQLFLKLKTPIDKGATWEIPRSIGDSDSESSYPITIIKKSGGIAAGNGPSFESLEDMIGYSALKLIYRPLNIQIPAPVKRTGIRGTVVIDCIVDIDGSVSDTNIKEGPKELQEFAAKVAKLHKFSPQKAKGIAVKSKFTLTIPILY